MLKFEHFWKCTPEMYPWAPAPFQISEYATGKCYSPTYTISTSPAMRSRRDPTR